jgi:hypothetical protein
VVGVGLTATEGPALLFPRVALYVMMYRILLLLMLMFLCPVNPSLPPNMWSFAVMTGAMSW